jgi:hypothetical protein
MNDREKALTIYEFDQAHRFHEDPQNGDNLDPIQCYNAYGYNLCGTDAAILTALYQKAGLRARAGWPRGHSTVEVFFDGAFRYLDGDEHIIALKTDNETIANEEDFVRDPWLLKRTHGYGIKGWPWEVKRNELTAALFWYRGSRAKIHSVTAGRTMGFELRSGEKLTWLWEERRKPVGRIAFAPNRDYAGKHFHALWEYTCRDDDAIGPFRVPWPIVGATIESSASGAIAVSLDGKQFKEAPSADWRKGIADDEFLALIGRKRNEPPPYAVWFRLPADLAAPVTLRLDLQVAPKSLPRLALGSNTFRYRDDSARREVEIVYVWRENHDNSPPFAPAQLVFPADGTKVAGSDITFEWTPAADPDGDKISDYEFVLSGDPDARRPLSSNFHALLSFSPHKGTTRWQTPHAGLLNPSRKYHWRVRARDERGCWGAWSGPWSFQVEAPATPVPLEPAVDHEKRTVTLRWKAASAKTVRVFGSRYRGFSPHAQPHKMLTEYRGDRYTLADEPSNLLAEVEGSEWVIGFDDTEQLRPFYRLQAVADSGEESGCSEQIEIPGPVLLSQPTVRLQPGQTRVPLSILSSAGRLANADPNGYHMTMECADTWRVEPLAQPIEAGKRVKARIQIAGSSYANLDRSAEFDLTLHGGGNGDWKPATNQPPSSHRVLLQEDFSSFQLARAEESSESYARVTRPLELTGTEKQTDGYKGKLAIDFSLLWTTPQWNCRHEIQLHGNDNQWVYLTITPWNSISIIQKLKGQDATTYRSPRSFAYPYGELVSFRWEIDEPGVHRVFRGSELIFELKLPSCMDAISQLRLAAVMNHPDRGSLGFGIVSVETR